MAQFGTIGKLLMISMIFGIGYYYLFHNQPSTYGQSENNSDETLSINGRVGDKCNPAKRESCGDDWHYCMDDKTCKGRNGMGCGTPAHCASNLCSWKQCKARNKDDYKYDRVVCSPGPCKKRGASCGGSGAHLECKSGNCEYSIIYGHKWACS